MNVNTCINRRGHCYFILSPNPAFFKKKLREEISKLSKESLLANQQLTGLENVDTLCLPYFSASSFTFNVFWLDHISNRRGHDYSFLSLFLPFFLFINLRTQYFISSDDRAGSGGGGGWGGGGQ